MEIMKRLLFSILVLNLSACVSLTGGKIKTAPTLHTVCEKDKIKIALPNRYKPESNYFSAIVFVKDIEKAEQLILYTQNDEVSVLIEDRVAKETQTEIETRLQNVKRLNIIQSYSKQWAEWKNEAGADESSESIIDNAETKQINHIIALELKKSKDIQKLSTRENIALFKSTLSYQVIKLNKEGARVIESGVVEGLSKRYKEYDLRWNRETREYDKILRQGEEDFDVEQASLQATCRASLLLVNKLSNAFPTVAKISRWAEDYINMSGDSDTGVMENQIFAIYTEDEGRDRAFALAKVIKIEKDISELKIFKWSESPFTKPIIKAIRENNSLVKQRDYYAVSAGLPPSFFSDETCTKKK